MDCPESRNWEEKKKEAERRGRGGGILNSAIIKQIKTETKKFGAGSKSSGKENVLNVENL